MRRRGSVGAPPTRTRSPCGRWPTASPATSFTTWQSSRTSIAWLLSGTFHKYGDDARGVRDWEFGDRRTNSRTATFPILPPSGSAFWLLDSHPRMEYACRLIGAAGWGTRVAPSNGVGNDSS